MGREWLWTPKPAFLAAWRALPDKEAGQVLDKIRLIEADPTPDGKVKKQLTYLNRHVYRLRSGYYRIFYTYSDPYISLLKLERRRDDTYDDALDAEFLGGFNPDVELSYKETPPEVYMPTTSEPLYLQEPITPELLHNLRVPEQYHPQLLTVRTEDDLLNCSDVPQENLSQILDYLFPPTLSQVMQQPDYLIDDLDDLMRYKEGELISFLLKLSPEQERFVSWAIRATGPTQVKGGPGTGKSTVALYRILSLIEKLLARGQPAPRILFTTYTNALKKSSEQLLAQLLRDNASYVEVKTVDKIVKDILDGAGKPPRIVREDMLAQLIQQSVKQSKFEGSTQQQQTQRQAIERLSHDYLLQEIGQVIVARQINTLDDYLSAQRPGRKVPLNYMQRKAVWRVYENFSKLLKLRGVETWHQARARAAHLYAQVAQPQVYDAVIVDEAQDLDPSILRLLISLCKSPNRFFITADANQSIYGSGFNWSDVHESLKFQGRTSVLRANYRSTRQIGEAAQSYLSASALDTEPLERIYVNDGSRPLLRSVRNEQEEVVLVASFLREATRTLRLKLGTCAILCPSEKAGETLASGLSAHGVNAQFMKGRELDLSCPAVKVLTLNSSKGLEFPVVALAGFIHSRYAIAPIGESEEEIQETLARERRTVFVGMTRAMRALLVVIPAGTRSPLLTGFDTAIWDIGT